jgi:DNA-binding MarR family transcriptional regulator
MDALQNSRRLQDVLPRAMLMVRKESQAAIEDDISFTQVRMLSHLDKYGAMTPGDLAINLGVTRPAISKLCIGLVKLGFVQRSAPGDDRRSYTLSLNPAGKKRVDRIRENAAQHISAHLQALSPQDQQRLSDALQVLEEILV